VVAPDDLLLSALRVNADAVQPGTRLLADLVTAAGIDECRPDDTNGEAERPFWLNGDGAACVSRVAEERIAR
jgi:hypothetical protein